MPIKPCNDCKFVDLYALIQHTASLPQDSVFMTEAHIFAHSLHCIFRHVLTAVWHSSTQPISRLASTLMQPFDSERWGGKQQHQASPHKPPVWLSSPQWLGGVVQDMGCRSERQPGRTHLRQVLVVPRRFYMQLDCTRP